MTVPSSIAAQWMGSFAMTHVKVLIDATYRALNRATVAAASASEDMLESGVVSRLGDKLQERPRCIHCTTRPLCSRWAVTTCSAPTTSDAITSSGTEDLCNISIPRTTTRKQNSHTEAHEILRCQTRDLPIPTASMTKLLYVQAITSSGIRVLEEEYLGCTFRDSCYLRLWAHRWTAR